jgi:GMP synthase-like glutamine amidotransferase
MRLGERLRDHGHRLRVVRLHGGDRLPPDLDEVDGIVTCGGAPSANDDSLPWLAAEMDLLRQAHAAALAVVGVCLGSQILARALGGAVGPLEGSIHLGWHPVTLTPAGCDDPLHAGIAWTSMAAHWHREEVKKLPPEARLLASSARCRVQAWTCGLRTYAFQHHPEIGLDTLDRWAEEEPEALHEAGTTRQGLAEETQRQYPAAARLADRLFENIALLLAPVDRRYRGMVKDLHH